MTGNRTASAFEAHEVLGRLGLKRARSDARSKAQRCCIDAAAAFLSSRERPVTTLMGAIAVTCLPHRDPGPGCGTWQRKVSSTTYVIESGTYPDGRPIGIPYGAKARVILLHLVDAATRSGSPRVPVEASMRAWIRGMGIATGGMSARHIVEQTRRISGCKLQIFSSEKGPQASRAAEGGFIARVGYANDADIEALAAARSDRIAFPDLVMLSAAFYSHILCRHAPLDLAALRLLANNSWAIDLYVWLATVLPQLEAPLWSSWGDLLARIDFGYAEKRRVRAKFLETWSLVKAVYPWANMRFEGGGMWFEPSPPAAVKAALSVLPRRNS